MGKNSYFQFKQFTIIQKHSAMKVGVDGVLLGAWADVAEAHSILDVGTGTGLIAIMMAQRSCSEISAVEIDKPSADEAAFNVSQSPWKERIKVYHTSFQEFATSTSEKFDLIVSNPPFFENSSRPKNLRRSNARHTDQLSSENMIRSCLHILSPNGKVALILPSTKAGNFIETAKTEGFFLNRSLLVRPNPAKPPHRCLLQFSTTETIIEVGEFMIEHIIHHDFTEEYITLTKDFYLNM
ncbi:MAG: methyltransferase [Prolixibacteraceae bacterium]|nr:methyltransferase [Prolixibacteraceae bacterium]